jgi:hypothetical protein
VCGSPDVRSSRPDRHAGPIDRFDVKATYRCVRRNASFRRNSPRRLLILLLILLGVLVVLNYLGLVALERGRPGDAADPPQGSGQKTLAPGLPGATPPSSTPRDG